MGKPIDPKLRAKCHEAYKALIRPLRRAARSQGYAIGVHGSLARDIDLICVPWRKTQVPPVALISELMETIKKVPRGDGFWDAFMAPPECRLWFQAGCPGMKPHGRLVWSIYVGTGPYLDISVIPPTN